MACCSLGAPSRHHGVIISIVDRRIAVNMCADDAKYQQIAIAGALKAGGTPTARDGESAPAQPDARSRYPTTDASRCIISLAHLPSRPSTSGIFGRDVPCARRRRRRKPSVLKWKYKCGAARAKYPAASRRSILHFVASMAPNARCRAI